MMASWTGGVPGTRAAAPDLLIWQLADSAFPTGGFAHSAGLEAAREQGAVRSRRDLLAWLEASLLQLRRGALPFVAGVHRDPGLLVEADERCEAFMTQHVGNRASRLQGRAWRVVVEKAFGIGFPADLPFCHLAPIFGWVGGVLGLERGTVLRLFVFLQLRGMLGAAVRLNVVGPLEAQSVQRELGGLAETCALAADGLGLDDVAQCCPLLDLWQGAQDRLYSRLFQS